MGRLSRILTPALVLGLGLGAAAQHDPVNGQWGKEEATDLRVMTWNVLDGINSQESKTAGLTQWESLARIVASMQPDVLLLQETGDFGSADTVPNLTTTIDLFLHGGNDPFNGGAVTAYVQLYAPSYDLPHVYVSTASDGFNRNCILSRYPFVDINGDGVSTHSDFLMISDLYAGSGGGGIRGFMFTEIDLPDATYAGDLIVGNSHLKAGGSSSDHTQRVEAGQRIAYLIDALYNGLGTGTADPNGRILNPAASQLLGADDLVVVGGDWNEDELNNGGTKGPADWITRAATFGGTDGTDRDRTDMTYDEATDNFNGSRATIGSTNKLDYIAWQDSIATVRNEFTYLSGSVPLASQPPEMATFPVNPGLASSLASDHRPVIVDLILPLDIGPWEDLGGGTTGINGDPTITGTGTLVGGTPAEIDLVNAPASALMLSWIALTSAPVNAFGGTIHATPFNSQLFWFADPSGELNLPTTWPMGIPPGTNAWFQFLIEDVSVPFGVTLSNALKITTP